MIAWLLSFLTTCAVELAIVWWLGPLDRRRLPVAFFAQLGTHPIVWLAMAALPGSQLARLVAVELWATLAEAAVYKRFLRMRGRDAFALSALANAASLLAVASAALVA